jgi:hypothetical protein
MSNHRRHTALAFAVAASALAPPAIAGAWRSPAAVNLPGAPFELVQVPTAPCSDSPVAGDGLSIQYAIRNTSAETLRQVGIEIVSFSAAGELKAFQTYTGGVQIAPGASMWNTYTTAGYHVAPGDRLVMLPYSASSGRRGTLRWEVPGEELFRRTQALRAAQGDRAPPAGEAGCLNPSLCNGCTCGTLGSFCESDASGALGTVRCECKECPTGRDRL